MLLRAVMLDAAAAGALPPEFVPAGNDLVPDFPQLRHAHGTWRYAIRESG